MAVALRQLSLEDQQPALLPADRKRLAAQYLKVEAVMADSEWWTLSDLADYTGHPEASVSARLREMRRKGWTVDRRRHRPGSGTWEYRAWR